MATGDKVYIADKPTLDAINSKVGTATDTGGSATGGSLFAKINAFLSHLLTHWTPARAARLDSVDATVSSRESEASAASRYNTINANTGTNNTANANGTLSQKMSYVIAQAEDINVNAVNGSKHLTSRQSRPNVNTTGRVTILNVTGAGELELIYAPELLRTAVANAVYVTLDGTQYTVGLDTYSIYLGRSQTPSGFPLAAITDVQYDQWKAFLKPLKFAKSLKIEINATVVPNNGSCIIDYALYE